VIVIICFFISYVNKCYIDIYLKIIILFLDTAKSNGFINAHLSYHGIISVYPNSKAWEWETKMLKLKKRPLIWF